MRAELGGDIPAVQAAAPSVRGRTQVVYGNTNWSTIVNGTTPGYFQVRAWKLAAGRPFAIPQLRMGTRRS